MLLWDGGDSRDRTGDLLLARQALSQLSYIPKLSSLPADSSPAPSKLNNDPSAALSRRARPLSQSVSTLTLGRYKLIFQNLKSP